MQTSRWPGVLRFTFQWGVAFLIGYFLIRRLIADWPMVQSALHMLRWEWVGVSVLCGLAYLALRVIAWRALLTVHLHLPWWDVARAWMNSEIIRYVPGSIWSVIGRFLRGVRLGATKQAVTVSMFLEIALLVLLAGALSGVLLVGAPLPLAVPSWLIGAVGAALFVVASPPVLLASMRVGHRAWPKIPVASAHGSLASAATALVLSWLFFAAAQVAVLAALGSVYGLAGTLHIMGAVIAAWLVGFLVIIAPSGFGVREAAVAALLSPLLGVPLALLFAVASRIVITLVEIAGLVIVNVLGRPRRATP